MSIALKAILSTAVAVGAVVAMARLAGALADVLGGVAVLVAMLVFSRAVMDFAAEPGDEPQQPRPR